MDQESDIRKLESRSLKKQINDSQGQTFRIVSLPHIVACEQLKCQCMRWSLKKVPTIAILSIVLIGLAANCLLRLQLPIVMQSMEGDCRFCLNNWPNAQSMGRISVSLMSGIAGRACLP
ncbi:hypothetical protein A6X21_16450 [Planctopirus hydrillae]|uniref:Uncharacterized protein n=1 Tax=Planctopirus hydrillae TaxID=1841610 RepID=A0A1C3ESU3_9PLAN|nr:hypothetical protein A6X21_16450 [Planctopirus hydrillae]